MVSPENNSENNFIPRSNNNDHSEDSSKILDSEIKDDIEKFFENDFLFEPVSTKFSSSEQIENPYQIRDKIAEDYDSLQRKNSIWNRSFEELAISTSKSEKRDRGRHKDADRSKENNSRNKGERSRPSRSDQIENEHSDMTNSNLGKNQNIEKERENKQNSDTQKEYHSNIDLKNKISKSNKFRERFRSGISRPNHSNDLYDNLEPTIGAKGKRGEPLSLAEELAQKRQKSDANEKTIFESIQTDFPDVLEKEGTALIAKLQTMSMQELVIEARKLNLKNIDDERRQDLIFRILKDRIQKNGLMFGEGTLEILPDEFGFLRSSDFHYVSCPDDIYISPSQIRRFGLRNGLTISGQIRPPKEKERYFALLRIEAINGQDPMLLASKPLFDNLTAMHPNERIVLETPDRDINTRIVDMIVPVGFGQRGLIVSPPRAGKTILMQKMAKAVLTNYPDSYVFMLLIDERPEEVTDMEREIKGTHCEVISSTFDEPPSRHIQVSEMVLEKAKRMVEYGKDVIIFLDSMTRLARAWNSECPTTGRTLTGGVDVSALQRPKKLFGAARKVEEGGSLTIIATALVDTGSKMDEVIFEEFKGTGNLEIWLDRSLVDKRIWPAINITQSGTRREEMILDPEEYRRISVLRRLLNVMNPADAMDYLTEKLSKTKKNAEFLMSLKTD